jgi:hypothetical protein
LALCENKVKLSSYLPPQPSPQRITRVDEHHTICMEFRLTNITRIFNQLLEQEVTEPDFYWLQNAMLSTKLAAFISRRLIVPTA